MARTGRYFFSIRRMVSYFYMNVVDTKNVSNALRIACSGRQQFLTAKRRTCLNVSRNYKHDCDSDSDSDEPGGDDLNDLYSTMEGKENAESLRYFLFPNSTDPLISQLNSCASVQDVFDTVRYNEMKMEGCHSSQAVLVLWDLQKIFVKIRFADELQNAVQDLFLEPQAIANDYVSQINTHEDFGLLLELVKRGTGDMSADEATCTLLYLNKMGVDLKNPVMQSLVVHCEKLIESMGCDFPLTALSRFTVASQRHGGLWLVYVLQKILPLIISKIETCENAEDLRLLTICLNNARQIIGPSILETYKSKVEDMIKNGSLTSNNGRTIVKAALFLNAPTWSQENADITRMLLSLFKGGISSLDPRDLVAVHRIFQNSLEPADLLDEMQQYAAHILSQEGDFLSAMQSSVDLLSCAVTFSSPNQRKLFEKLTSDHLENVKFSSSMVTLFKVIRNLKTSNVNLCDKFWCKTLKYLELSASERIDYKLLRQCYRYMHFNNNLGGTYRHYEFEKKVIQWLLEEIRSGMCGVIPSKFSRAASFLIAYGSIGQDKAGEAILKLVVDKLIEMSPQLSELDCLSISRGFQVAMQLRYRKSASEFMMGQFVRLDGLLNDCLRRHLKNKHCTLSSVNLLMRSYINRNGAQESEFSYELIKRYRNFEGPMSSRSVRDATLNLLSSGCLLPEAVDRLVQYVIDHNVHLLGETVEKVLNLCYSQGYCPTKADTFLSVASDIILRDKSRLNGMSVLQAALALSYFHHLPEELVHFIFTVDFLERLDEEISLCYSKATYPVRLRHSLMQLNRTVCLDYPELDIPWFHQKYCQEIASLEPAQTSSFHRDVKKVLGDVLGERELVNADVHSPYGYKIDFLILLNKDGKPVHKRHLTDKDVTRCGRGLLKAKGDDPD
ncbi:FAST kinase domain-containing protein 1, mitochondrial isoform X2 [Anabrus simplex]|uniref:FAST kinase domain-containing protein 1, mitochondrial isoform X2 n=1 Tax=Anabrus simplex TaxID=316456 RepID=UPI0035A37321